ncbi:MAG TPA: hypothetical protein VNT01_00305 [Symbiobacteriaceae bacterium]|nr:hypothetical protein [Symbiobacteriaceae bacterium]
MQGSSNPFRLMTALFLTAGLFFAVLRGLGSLPGVPGPANLNWLRVHLLTIGTVTQMIFATLPGLVARKLATGDRAPAEAWLQWGLVNGGFLLIIAGIVGVDSWTAALGATLLFSAVWRLLGGILAAFRASGHWREGMRFYVTAPVFLLVGITMAVSLVFGWWAPGGRPGTLEAHVHANVWGFLALVVTGTLLDFFPVAAGAPLARPGWAPRIYWLLTAGCIGLIAGPWLGFHPLTVAGMVAYMTGTAILVINLVLTLTGHRRANPAALHIVLAYTWMFVPTFFAPFILFAPHLVRVPAVEAAALQGLVNGWVLGVVMGALPLVLRRESDNVPDRGSWHSVATLNAGVALIWLTAVVANPTVVTALMISGYGLIALAWIPLLRRTWAAVAA